MAVFQQTHHQNKVNLYYGDSTGFAKTINRAQSPRHDDNGRRLLRLRAERLQGLSAAVHGGPDYSEMFGILLQHIAKVKPGPKIAFVNSDTEFGRDPIGRARRWPRSSPSTWW